MIRPDECGPLPEWAEELMDRCETAVDDALKRHYDPRKHEPVSIFGQVNDMRVCGDLRVFDEFIARYNRAGWSCVWITDSTDGISSPYLVAQGHEPNPKVERREASNDA